MPVFLSSSMHEREYQKQLKSKLETALSEMGLKKFSVKWDPYENRGDLFVINDSGREILVIEVKKTRQDASSPRYWDQARRYVLNSSNWNPGTPKIFCTTNGEVLYAFCLRPDFTHIKYCLLKKGIKENGSFGKNGEADAVLLSFKDSIKDIIKLSLGRSPIEYDENWYPILERFRVEVKNISLHIEKSIDESSSKKLFDDLFPKLSNEECKKSLANQTAATILFKALCYEVIRTILKGKSIKSLREIRLNPINQIDEENIANSLAEFYSDILRIDYRKIFDEDKIPTFFAFSDPLIKSIMSFVSALNKIDEAKQEISNTDFLVSSLVNALTTDEEKHEYGFAIEDRGMAENISSLIILKHDDKVVDIAAGTCSLLDSAYDKILRLKVESRLDADHQSITNQISAIEGNQFIAKIGVLRLALRNPLEETNVNLTISDTFQAQPSADFDSLLCNPPYLRHERISKGYKKFMSERISSEYKRQGVKGKFPYSTGQSDKYFYFIEWGYLFLREGGRAGFILSDKFLNSKAGKQIRKFLLERTNLIAVVKYPGKHFEGLDVTTCFLVFERGSPRPQNKVKFVKLFEEVTSQQLVDLIEENKDVNDSIAKVIVKDQKSLSTEQKWDKFLLNIPVSYNYCYDQPVMRKLSEVFTRYKRGRDNGCNAFFFPSSTSFKRGRGESISGFEERKRKYQEKIKKVVNALEEDLLKPALNNSDVPKNYILTKEDTRKDLLLCISDKPTKNARDLIKLADKTYIDNGVTRSVLDGNEYAVSKRPTTRSRREWYKLYEKDLQDNYAIIIPRMHRASFKVLVPSERIFFSTNFVGFGKYGEMSEEDITFIAAFLMSSLGQLQFEVEGDWREGLLKVEAGNMYSLKIPDPSQINHEKKKLVVDEFKKLKFRMSGLERPGNRNSRFNLDKSVLALFFPMEECEDKAIEIEEALLQTVQDRDPENKRR